VAVKCSTPSLGFDASLRFRRIHTRVFERLTWPCSRKCLLICLFHCQHGLLNDFVVFVFVLVPSFGLVETIRPGAPLRDHLPGSHRLGCLTRLRVSIYVPRQPRVEVVPDIRLLVSPLGALPNPPCFIVANQEWCRSGMARHVFLAYHIICVLV
jgi:hypothetical protein